MQQLVFGLIQNTDKELVIMTYSFQTFIIFKYEILYPTMISIAFLILSKSIRNYNMLCFTPKLWHDHLNNVTHIIILYYVFILKI